MSALGSRLAPRPARQILGDAGPPASWVALAYVGGLAAGGALWRPHADHTLVVITVLAVALLPSVLDRTGWQVRLGLGWLAAEQRRRMGHVPRTRAAAVRWLAARPPDASPFVTATVLLTAGRSDEARAMVAATPAETPEDRVRSARLLAAIDGLRTGSVDARAAESAMAELPADLRRYHRVSLAWTTAWVDVMHGRPWRRGFAAASAGIRPADLPLRYLAWHVLNELLPALIVVAFGLFLLATGVL